MLGATKFGIVQRALAAALTMFAHALAGASTNVAPVEIHETLQGHFVYMKNCVFCHGKRGDGKGEMGLTIQPPPRDFAAGVFKYRSTPSGSLPTNDDLMRTVREGIPDTAMPSFAALPQRDLQAVVEYVKTFSPRWRQRENYAAPIAIPKRPDWFEDAKDVARRVENGRTLYTVSCAPCHGPKGDGHGIATNLVDSWGNPTPARDLRLPYVRRGRQLEDLYKVLVTGLDGTPMPSFAEGTTETERWELIAFIEQLRRDYQGQQRPDG
jgi:mono/diheme cytochrome c family protein